MLFNSLDFLLFFPIVCLIYYCIPWLRARNVFLLIASYYFYMNWQPVYALLLLSSTAITWSAAHMIGRSSDSRRRRAWLIASLVLNLGILCFFKYYYFLGENITGIMHVLGISFAMPNFNILLPVGISFYTFQALGYSIDVYRGTIKCERNFLTYALFVSFFPQLVAGPIERASSLLPQFHKKHSFDGSFATEGVKMMLWGYFLKLVLADHCAIYNDEVFNNPQSHPGYSALVAAVLFCFQLYGDFAGYSYIAIGCARIMGFRLMDNFRRPYLFAVNVQDYWKRNHISLTTWFMDYVYYPLTEKRDSLNWWCMAIVLTFAISGLWHGAAWTFVVWGLIQGLLLVVEMRTAKRRRRFEKRHGLSKKSWYLWCNRIIVFMVIAVSLVFFRMDTISDSLSIIGMMFSPSDFSLASGKLALTYSGIAIAILFVKEYCDEFEVKSAFVEAHRDVADVVWMFFLSMCIMFLGYFDGSQFMYFQF